MEPNTDRIFNFLPLTISIETLGGISTPLVLRGTPLPVTRSQVFSTAQDNQSSVEINILMGESSLAKRNISITKFILKEIPLLPRGQPQITVTFKIDKYCKISASAIEKSGGKRMEIIAENAKLYLSDSEIKRIIDDAEKIRNQDENELKQIEINNRARNAVRKAENLLQESQQRGITGESYRHIERALAALGLVIETSQITEIREKTENLEQALIEQSKFGSYPVNDLFSGGGFDSLFNLFNQTSKKTSSKSINKPEFNTPESQGTKIFQLGKIFGGGEFTLDPNLCFVLMPFKIELKPIFDDHIRPVVESKGLSCTRADSIIGTGLITWDIWEKINRSRFIIADLTNKNPNVFYELGICHSLGKETILITQTMDDVPFDLKALRCIVYSFTPRGMKEMEVSLSKTIDKIMKSA